METGGLQLDHVEVALGRAALGTDPVVRNVSPSRAGCQTFVRIAHCFVIDVAASPALPGFIGFGVHRDRPSCDFGIYLTAATAMQQVPLVPPETPSGRQSGSSGRRTCGRPDDSGPCARASRRHPTIRREYGN